MDVLDAGMSRIWPVQLFSVVGPADLGWKIPAFSNRIRSESTGSGREPVWNGSGWLPFSWNPLEVKGSVQTMGRKIEDFTGNFL